MVELEEIAAGELCPAPTRAVMLQKRFHELITNIIKDTHDTFSSLMEDLEKGKKPVKKLPSLLPQTDRFHCQMARRSWSPPKPRAGSGFGDCGFDVASMNSSDIGGSCGQNGGSFEPAASLTLLDMDRDEYEASERLKRLIEEELRFCRTEIAKDRTHMLYPRRTDSSYLEGLGRECPSYSQPRVNSKTVHSDFETIGEYPTSSQRLDSLIRDELDRMKTSVAAAKDQLTRISAKVDAPKEDVKPLQSRLTTCTPINFTPRPKIWADILQREPPVQLESTEVCDSSHDLQEMNSESDI